jgi:hypothetical protein
VPDGPGVEAAARAGSVGFSAAFRSTTIPAVREPPATTAATAIFAAPLPARVAITPPPPPPPPAIAAPVAAVPAVPAAVPAVATLPASATSQAITG